MLPVDSAFPKNEDVLRAINVTSIEKVITNTIQHVSSELNVNVQCVVIWLVKNSKWEWFLAYIKEEVSEEEYVIDHVERLTERNDSW